MTMLDHATATPVKAMRAMRTAKRVISEKIRKIRSSGSTASRTSSRCEAGATSELPWDGLAVCLLRHDPVPMLISVERLLIKLRQPAPRADELIDLRRRLRDEVASEADEEERQLAHAVHARKLEVSAEVRAVSSCGSCAIRLPWPLGGYDGGACCSGVTAELFDDTELAALAQTGTRTRHLVPPPRTDAQAGCAFRGSRGCTLEVAHRPSRCVQYVCDTLRHELHDRRELDVIEAKLVGLHYARQRFSSVHQARRDREVLAPLIAAIAAASARGLPKP